MKAVRDLVKVGHYAYAKELHNGEWSLYVGRWSDKALGHVTGLVVCRDVDKPIRFPSLQEAREYAEVRAL